MSFTIDLSNPVVLCVLGIFSVPIFVTIFILYVIFINKIMNFIFSKVSFDNYEFFSFLGTGMIVVSQIVLLSSMLLSKVGR